MVLLRRIELNFRDLGVCSDEEQALIFDGGRQRAVLLMAKASEVGNIDWVADDGELPSAEPGDSDDDDDAMGGGDGGSDDGNGGGGGNGNDDDVDMVGDDNDNCDNVDEGVDDDNDRQEVSLLFAVAAGTCLA